MPLEGKAIVLTGAAGGIGKLLARELSDAGGRVVGIDRVECPDCAETLIADLGSRDGLEMLARDLGDRRVDILINLAGIQYFGPFERHDPSAIWSGYIVNLVAPALLMRAVVPQMLERGDGQLVAVGSVMGAVNYPHFATYSSSKCGLRGLCEGLRRELHQSGIAVTYIAPRAVRTGFNDDTVNRFLAVAKMTADDPADVARRLARAIAERRKDVTLGAAERFYTRLNGAFPRLVDAGLAGTTAKARRLFDNHGSRSDDL